MCETENKMLANDVIDFFMEELNQPTACPRKIRKTIKQLASVHPHASIGRHMLTDQLIDILFDVHESGKSDTVELGMALKSKLNRYMYSLFVPVRLDGVILPLRPSTAPASRQVVEL